MKKFLFTTLFFISHLTFGQNGINYKAIIKDGGGTILANDVVQVQFTVFVGGLSLYSEAHSPTTDSNGIIAVNIGEGTPISGTFGDIDWSIMNSFFLNVKINTGGGFVDMGTTAFKAVPFALHAATAETAKTAANATGLEALYEGGGVGGGWRLTGVDPDDYGDIGVNAVDLSTSLFGSTTNGATGNYATAMGRYVIASGIASTAMGWNTDASASYSSAMGFQTVASGESSTAMGYRTYALGEASTAMGYATDASGESSTAMGYATDAPSYGETVIGIYNTLYTPNSTDSWNATDRLFVVGNGTDVFNRSDAMVINKTGLTTINSDAVGLKINALNSNGIDITNAGNNAVRISSPAADGVQVFNPGSDGIYVNSSGSDGIEIDNAGDTGVRVNSPNTNGIAIFNSGDAGVWITSSATDGVQVNSANRNGGFFKGVLSGVHAESSLNANPDLILGGQANTTTGDDGIIASDPEYAGSDIFLRSNDAVVVQLDFDDNELGEFEIKNGAGDEVFEVTESGNVRVNGTIVHSSDRRLKKDIEALPYGLNEILQLQPKAYNWKYRTQENKSLGLLAQDVQPIIKEIVTVKDDAQKTLGVSYTELIPVLINAIKEQQTQIEKLQDVADSEKLKVANLESDVLELKTMVQQLIVKDEIDSRSTVNLINK